MAMLTSALHAYQRNVLQMRQSSAIDFPAHVHLETMAQCNAACNFCPYPGLERKGTVMDDALIAKVVNDLADIPRLHSFQLSPFKVNEPFLDKRLFDLLDMFTARLPNAKLTLTSNASPITLDKLQRLAGFSNLDYLWISFNDHRQVEYESTMQLPYRRTIERLQMIHKAKAEGWLPLRVVLSRVGDGTAADLDFRQWVDKNFPLFSASIFPRGEWIGQVAPARISPPPRNRLRALVRCVDYRHRGRRALLHGRRGGVPDWQCALRACARDLQQTGFSPVARGNDDPPGGRPLSQLQLHLKD